MPDPTHPPLLCGRWQDHMDALAQCDVLLTDPPYGIAYKSNSKRATLPNSIAGDESTAERDALLQWWGDKPALVFGSWRRPRPAATRALLVWDTKGALGMGDLSIPWKPSHQEIYVLGRGFTGPRDTDVLRHAPVQSMARNGRLHPHQKPVTLLLDLLRKVPEHWVVGDPFAGVGSVAVACLMAGRRSVSVELDPTYHALAERRVRKVLSDAV